MTASQKFSRPPTNRRNPPPSASKGHARNSDSRPPPDTPSLFYVSGRRPVESLLAKCKSRPDKVRERLVKLVVLAHEAELPGTLSRVAALAKELSIQTVFCSDPKNFPAPAEENHQRVCLVLREYPTAELEDVLTPLHNNVADQDGQEPAAGLFAKARGCVGLVLDQIQDPRNFGAILRSAAFFGQKFVVFGKDRQATLSPLVYRSSAGGASELDLVEVTNINRAIEKLKEAGLWIVVTTCGEQSTPPHLIPLDRPYILVLGNEEKGVRREILKAADYKMEIPGGVGALDSLNVSVAAGIALFALTQKSQ